MNVTATTAPRASGQESLEAELVEQAELLAADAARLRRRSAELNRELFNACGWTVDLPDDSASGGAEQKVRVRSARSFRRKRQRCRRKTPRRPTGEGWRCSRR